MFKLVGRKMRPPTRWSIEWADTTPCGIEYRPAQVRNLTFLNKTFLTALLATLARQIDCRHADGKMNRFPPMYLPLLDQVSLPC